MLQVSQPSPGPGLHPPFRRAAWEDSADSFTKPSEVGGRRGNVFIPVRSALGRLFLSFHVTETLNPGRLFPSFHVAETLNLLSASPPLWAPEGAVAAVAQAHPCDVSCPSRSCMDVIGVSLVGHQGPGSVWAQPARATPEFCCTEPELRHAGGFSSQIMLWEENALF